MTGNWIWRRLTHNVGWKLASLALAVMLWLYVAGEPEQVAIQSIPVLYRNLPDSLLLLPDAPAQVRAELRGPSARLARATLSDAFASLDLAGVVSIGEQTFTLSRSDFSLPQGVRFVRAVPSQLQLHFEHISRKTVPVEIQLKGRLPAGYTLAAQAVEPPTLIISGPESSINAVHSAKTDPVDLTDLAKSTDIKVNTFVSEAHAQLESSSQVTVHLTIEKSENIP